MIARFPKGLDGSNEVSGMRKILCCRVIAASFFRGITPNDKNVADAMFCIPSEDLLQLCLGLHDAREVRDGVKIGVVLQRHDQIMSSLAG